MSVYLPKKKTKVFQYDFVIRGERFHGSTGQKTKRQAEAYERSMRALIAEGQYHQDAGDLTLNQGAERWFREKVVGTNSEKDVERRLLMLLDFIGQNRRLRDITSSVVADAIMARRGRLYRGNPIAGATVNRDIIAPLRTILRRAKRTWQARNMPEIEWRDHLCDEKSVTREFTDDEVNAWRDACRTNTERTALRLLLTYGMRFGELWFDPSDVDVTGRRLTLRNRKAKEVSTLFLPLLEEDARDLGRLASTALAVGQTNVWGLRYGQLHYRLRTAAKLAGIKGGRIIHGARHHAGTKIMRQTGNLAIAQKLLGHATILSTIRYAHAAEGDVRTALQGLDKVSRNSPERIVRRVRKPDGGQGTY